MSRYTGRELSDLLAPTSPAEFVSSCWGRAPRVCRGAPERIAQVFGRTFDPAGFVRASNALAGQEGQVTAAHRDKGLAVSNLWAAHLPHDGFYAGRGPRPFVGLRPGQVEPILAGGYSVQLNGLDSLWFGAEEEMMIGRAAEAIRAQLHYPGDVLVGATCSPRGARFEPHFDPTGAFIVQTHGHKRYTFSSRPLVESPRGKGLLFPDGSVHYTVGRKLSDEREEWESARWDDSIWAEPQVLGPGDVLYLPPGVAHHTEALSEMSVALLVIFTQKGPRDLLNTLLARLLRDRPEWRKVPVWVGEHGGVLAPEAREFLDARLDELRGLLHELKAEGPELGRVWQGLSVATEAWGPPRGRARALTGDDRVSVARDVPLRRAFGTDRAGEVRLYLFRGTAELELEGAWAGLAERVLAAETVAVAAILEWPELPEGSGWDEVAEVLGALVEFGALTID